MAANLYPFEQTVAGGADFDTCIENIDIGGPAMIRAAAKNHDGVTVVVDPADYARGARRDGRAWRRDDARVAQSLAARAFARTAAYDAAIADWFAGRARRDDAEDAHHRRPAGRDAALRREPASIGRVLPHRASGASASPPRAQVQGKALCYNNLNDTDAAYELVAEFDPKASAGRRHHQARQSLRRGDRRIARGSLRARRCACDPVSAFGGIVALNRTLDADAAREIVKIFTEVIIAPDASDEAKAILAEKKNLRLLLAGGLPDPRARGSTFRSLAGGFLVQSRDNGVAAARSRW